MAFVNQKQGELDPALNSVLPLSTGTWDDLTAWQQFTQWNFQPQTIIWTSDLLDFGSLDFFTLEVITEYQGSVVNYTIHTSETGEFSGEEDELIIEEGDTNIPAFYARYVYVTITLVGNALISMDINASRETFDIVLKNINTSTLPGTVSARQLTFTESPSRIVNLEIVPINDTPYDMDVYVTDYPVSRALIPVITDKTSEGPVFSLVGLDNIPRDGNVDVIARALPGQQMSNGQITRVT
jgi:hypothetical protein